ncbi:hypothetical protein OAX11_00485, partial [Flavobacteriaceae bacterium]|nr:hypothetical protein [Flavobacteriaceae bacterium]
MKPKSSSKKCLFKPFYYAVFALLFSQIIWAQCPTVGNTNITTCAFDGTNITKVSDLITLAGVSGGNPNVVWYDSLTGGGTISDITPLTDGFYYLDTDLGECPTRIAVTVDVEAEGSPSDANILGTVKCLGEKLINIESEFLSLGNDFLWYADETSTTPLDENTQVFSNTNFYISFLENGCESQKSLFQVFIIPSTPTEFNLPNPICLLPGENITIADLDLYVTNSNGNSINWYDTESDALSDYSGDGDSSNDPLLSSEIVIDGEDYWAVTETIPCPSTPSVITPNLEIQPQTGTPNPVGPFCETEGNNGTLPTEDLTTMLSGTVDTGGEWTETSGTSELSDSSDTIIDIQNIYNSLGVGSYSFTYTITNGTDPETCISATTITIIIEPLLVAGTALPPVTICENNLTSNFDLFTLLIGNDLGGDWSDNTPTGALSGSNLDLTAITTPYNPSGYDFTYSINNGTTCPVDTEVVTIIITEAPELIINSPENFCLNDTSVGTINLSTYLTTDSSGGTGSWTDTNTTGALTIPDTIDVTILQGLGEGSYAFNYLVDNGDGCTEEINMIIVIDPENEAGIANNITICETNIVNNFDLFTLLTDNDLGGTWTDNTPTGALSGNIIDLTAVATPYNPSGYQFTYTASNATCPDDNATVTIIITETPEAGTNQSINICISATTPSSIDLFSILTDEDAGGNWTDVSSSGALSLPSTVDISVLQGLGAATYIYEYTIDNGDGCIDSAQVNIVIEDEPDPINETIDICLTDINNGTFPF